MMPKGVEHRAMRRKARTLPSVKIPMMPKGVEHEGGSSAIASLLREDSYDAERR